MIRFQVVIISYSFISLLSECVPATILLRPVINLREMNKPISHRLIVTESVVAGPISFFSGVESVTASIKNAVNLFGSNKDDATKSASTDKSLRAEGDILCDPKIGCDENKICSTALVEGDKKVIGAFYQKINTTCLPAYTKKSLHLLNFRGKNYARQGNPTTSTMAPFVSGYTPGTDATPAPIEKLKCDKIANCKEHKW